MSLGARILLIDAEGRVVATLPGQEPPSAAEVMVVVADDHAPGQEILAEMARAPGAAGVDALCRIEPVVDALVELDRASLVDRHLERDRHVRAAFPQVVAADWWPRLVRAVEAHPAGGPPIDLVGLVAALGGRVATLEDSASRVD